ncbi:MAG: cupin domain-containing protein [Patescibacteria group bacterium]|nr:cupin domain-containing protein [Patescibacteria group bacterium]MDD4610338.1 cupin domain-containing protein [Patescibacteria group bacterium]
MKIYPKQSKSDRQTDDFYFGDYGEIPIGVSFVTIDKNNQDEMQDKLHYHLKSKEFYIILEGEGILEVENKEIILNSNSMIMVEPNEKHRIVKAIKLPFSFIAISTEKNKNDKIIIEK